MKKIINFRAFLFLFIGAIFGAIFSLLIIQKNLLAFIFSGILVLGLFVFLLYTKLFKKAQNLNYLKKFLLCLFIGFFTFLCLGVLDYAYFNKNINDIENCRVTARVSSVSENSQFYYLILEDCSIKKENKKSKVNGNISVVVYFTDAMNEIKVGDKLFFTGTLISSKLLKDNVFQSYLYKNRIKYSCFIDENSFKKTTGTLHFDEKLREKVKNILFNNLSFDNASIAYASIFGDKTLINDKLVNSFSISGTAHLLCVSGLHVGFLVTLLYFLFNILKIKKKYIFIILCIILILYCYLCGFSTSVVRATIMSIVLAGSACFGNFKYDGLSSLSLAGLIILFVSPFMIFDLGFQLSFASCFGIILLMPIFNKFFKKIRFNNKFTQIFSLTLSAQISTFPILLHNFEKMSFLSLCANIVIVPLFSIIFMFLIVFVILNLVFQFGFLFKVIEVSLNFIIMLTKGFGSITEAIFYYTGDLILINVFFYSSIVLVSEYINITTKSKMLCLIVCVMCILLTYAYQLMPIKYNNNFILNSQVECATIITNSDDEKILIITKQINENDLSLIVKDLNKFKILKLDALILSDYNEDMQKSIVILGNKYKIDNLYVNNSLQQNAEKFLFKNLKYTKVIKTDDNFYSYSNFTFKIYENINSVYINVLDKQNAFDVFLFKDLNKMVSNFLTEFNIEADIMKFRYINKNFVSNLKCENILCKNSSIKQNNIFNISKISDKIKLGENLSYAI